MATKTFTNLLVLIIMISSISMMNVIGEIIATDRKMSPQQGSNVFSNVQLFETHFGRDSKTDLQMAYITYEISFSDSTYYRFPLSVSVEFDGGLLTDKKSSNIKDQPALLLSIQPNFSIPSLQYTRSIDLAIPNHHALPLKLGDNGNISTPKLRLSRGLHEIARNQAQFDASPLAGGTHYIMISFPTNGPMWSREVPIQFDLILKLELEMDRGEELPDQSIRVLSALNQNSEESKTEDLSSSSSSTQQLSNVSPLLTDDNASSSVVETTITNDYITEPDLIDPEKTKYFTLGRNESAKALRFSPVFSQQVEPPQSFTWQLGYMGSWGWFYGTNPAPFTCKAYTVESVCDSTGACFSYDVSDPSWTFIYPRDSNDLNSQFSVYVQINPSTDYFSGRNIECSFDEERLYPRFFDWRQDKNEIFGYDTTKFTYNHDPAFHTGTAVDTTIETNIIPVVVVPNGLSLEEQTVFTSMYHVTWDYWSKTQDARKTFPSLRTARIFTTMTPPLGLVLETSESMQIQAQYRANNSNNPGMLSTTALVFIILGSVFGGTALLVLIITCLTGTFRCKNCTPTCDSD